MGRWGGVRRWRSVRARGGGGACLIAVGRQSPLASRTKRGGSSPPSPVLLLPPSRFIAIARFSCASLLIDPNDIAPVLKRLTIADAGSTSSIGTGCRSVLNLSRLLSVAKL